MLSTKQTSAGLLWISKMLQMIKIVFVLRTLKLCQMSAEGKYQPFEDDSDHLSFFDAQVPRLVTLEALEHFV